MKLGQDQYLLKTTKAAKISLNGPNQSKITAKTGEDIVNILHSGIYYFYQEFIKTEALN